MAKKKAAAKAPAQQTVLPPPVNELAVKLAARQEANAQRHAELLDKRLAAVADKRASLAAHPAVPASKRPL